MKILIIGGFLGSGKTTMLINMGRYYASLGNKVGIIVNEIGEVGVDGDIISKYGLETKEITSGCICCSLKMSLRTTIKTMREGFCPDILIIEPTGVAYPGVVKTEIELMDLPDDCEIMPLLTLFDGSRFKQIMKEIKKFAAGQINDAEIIAVSKIDLVDPMMIPIIEEGIRQMNPKAKITAVSSKSEESMIALLNLVDKTAATNAGKKNEPVSASSSVSSSNVASPSNVASSSNFVSSASGNELNFSRTEIPVTGGVFMVAKPSVESAGISSFAEEYVPENPDAIDDLSDDDASSVVKIVMERIHAKLVSFNPDFVGHVKLFLDRKDKTFRINLTSGDQEPDFAVIDAENEIPAFKILVAASGIHKKDIEASVREIVTEVFSENVD